MITHAKDQWNRIKNELGRLAIDAPIDVSKCLLKQNRDCVVWLTDTVQPIVAGLIQSGVSTVSPGVRVIFTGEERFYLLD